MSYFTFESIGIAARINCSRCGNGMDNQRRKPRTGLCGHSICEQCFNAKYIFAKKAPADFDTPGPFYRCCAPMCNEPAFSLGTPTSSSLMIAISLLDQLKWGVNSHLIKIHDKYNAFDIMSLQNELKIAKNDIQSQKTKLNIEIELARNKMLKALNEKDDALEEKEKALKEKQAALEEKEEAECRIENQRGYIGTLHKRLSGLPLDEDPPSPTDLSQQLDDLHDKLCREKKREYNTDTDSSLGSLEMPAKKVKAAKGRKVSLDNVPKKTSEESPAPKFSYGLGSSQSTTSIQSTQENEF